MCDFVSPDRKTISPNQYIKNLVDATLIKDLHDNEEVCEHCAGTGMVVVNNRYGLSNDPDRKIRFPYNHQSISFCQHCYNGIVHRCKLCGEIMPRGRLKHDCKPQWELDRREEARKSKAELDKAPEASSCECMCSDWYPRNEGYFFDWDDFFEHWGNNYEGSCTRPEYVWGTESVEMHIDAHTIVEQATEDLYEDAIDNISDKKISELQAYLDKWCKDCGVGRTYYESHKFKIRIPWEDYK